jgi:mannose-6-phosphate isomerase-like protein (cupin superfamily)
MSETATVHNGDGYTAAHIDDLGEGPGFRRLRDSLGVTGFAANAIVLPAGDSTGFLYHDRQEELYIVHRGRVRMTFGDGTEQELEPGGVALVAPTTHRMVASIGDEDALYFVVGGADGYVGSDGHRPD